MPGNPRKRARREAIARGDHVPGRAGAATQRRTLRGREPTEAEIITVGEWLEGGQFFETAIAAIGVSRDIARGWLDRGASDLAEGLDETPVAIFAAVVAESRARGVALLQGSVMAAGRATELTETTYDDVGHVARTKTRQDRGDWRATAWALERLDPSRYGARVQVVVEGEIRAILEAIETVLPPDQYARVLEAIAQARSTTSTSE